MNFPTGTGPYDQHRIVHPRHPHTHGRAVLTQSAVLRTRGYEDPAGGPVTAVTVGCDAHQCRVPQLGRTCRQLHTVRRQPGEHEHELIGVLYTTGSRRSLPMPVTDSTLPSPVKTARLRRRLLLRLTVDSS